MATEKNRPCPECRKNLHDKDGNHMFLMSSGSRWTCRKVEFHDGGIVYYENAEGYTDSLPRASDSEAGDEGGTAELLRMLAPDSGGIIALPVHVPTGPGGVDVRGSYRGIKAEVFKKYKTVGTYDSGGNLLSLVHGLKDTKGNDVVDKVRKLPKDFFTTGKTEGVPLQFFGQDVIPKAKRILITEGELDALSAYQMLEKYKVGVWSLPLGANKKCFVDNLEILTAQCTGKRELYISMDQDDAGRKLEKELAVLFPKAKFLKLDKKDANSYLETGANPEDFLSAFWGAEIWKPETIVRVSSIIEDVLKRPTIGRPWPWPTMTASTFGRREGEGMFVGAGVKIGKSEFINELIAFDVKNKWPIACIKFEEQPKETVKRVAGKIDGIMYHKPGVIYKDEDLRATSIAMDPYLFLHRAFGQARWDGVKTFIRYAVAMGCKTIIIDPITKITNGMTPSETETELRRFSDELACMAQDMGFFYIVTCHLKSPSSGVPHERGGKVETYQFRGSRAMAENCFYFVGIQRNKDPDLSEDERNTSTFVCLDDRAFGGSFKFPVFYNIVDQSYLEPATSLIF